jgi:hypothetical protein
MAQATLSDGRVIDLPEISLSDPKKTERVLVQAWSSYTNIRWWNIRASRTLKYQLKFEKARKKVKPMVEKVSQKLNLDEHATEALLDVVAVMRSSTNAKDKLAAAKLVLDFTMAKPASKSDIKVSSAEDWLKSIADDTK